jgi:peptide/nickel transport system permease protein
VVLFGVTLVVFFMVHLIPGDPGRQILGSRATTAQVAALDHRLGLDRSLVAQYEDFASGLVRGDFGQTISGTRRPVVDAIVPRIMPTLLLGIYSIVLTIMLAVPVAIISALRANRLADHLIRGTSVVFYAVPEFWFGVLLAMLFGLQLHFFPTSGYSSVFPSGTLETLTLPAVTLALAGFPILARILRASMIENLSAEFVVAAHARGLSKGRVLLRYTLRNSLTSSLTFVGISLGALVGGAVVVEQVFGIAGLGSLLISSVSARDYPTVQALTLLFAVAVLAGNLLADLGYGALDPRVRL